MALAHPDRIGRDLDELVIVDELQRRLQPKFQWGGEQNVLVTTGRSNVGELLLFHGVYGQVVVPAVYANHHAFVYLIVGPNHHAAAILQIEDRKGDGFAFGVGDQHTAAAKSDTLGHLGRKSRRRVGHEATTRCNRQEGGTKSHQSTRCNSVVELHPATAVGAHFLELATTCSQRFHDLALMSLLDIGGEQLKRLPQLTVHFLVDDVGARNRQLIAFATHGFDEYRKV